VSACWLTDTYSPAAIESAPADTLALLDANANLLPAHTQKHVVLMYAPRAKWSELRGRGCAFDEARDSDWMGNSWRANALAALRTWHERRHRGQQQLPLVLARGADARHERADGDEAVVGSENRGPQPVAALREVLMVVRVARVIPVAWSARLALLLQWDADCRARSG
jgi:hypothetical protein